MTSGHAMLARVIAESGGRQVFSMLGGTNVPWLAYGMQQGLFGVVKTRHEETAFNAAVGYARATGTVGVCTVTRGSGFANVVGALLNAVQSHVPVVLVVGESPATTDRTTQNIDQRSLTRSSGAGFHHVVDPDQLTAGYRSALAEAKRAGIPQVFSVADGLLDGEVIVPDSAPTDARAARTERPDRQAIGAAVDLIASGRRPLVLAGEGAVLSESREALLALADLIGADLATTLRANRFFAGHPRDLGLCGGWAAPASRERIEQADVVIAFGASLNSWTTDRSTLLQVPVVHVDVRAGRCQRARPPEVAVQSDAGAVAQAIAQEWRARKLESRSGLEPLTRKRISESLLEQVGRSHPGLDSTAVYSHLDRVLPADRVIVTDTGRHLETLPVLIDAKSARRWLLGRGFGVTGRGLGMAIGARVAYPGLPVVLVCGDGGFAMALSALDDLRINRTPLIVVIVNDQQYGSEVKYLDRHQLPRDLIRQSLPEIPQLARTFGGTGFTVRSIEELEAVPFSYDTLQIIDVRVPQDALPTHSGDAP